MKGIIKIIVVFLTLTASCANATLLPNLGDYSSVVLPQEKEQDLGKLFFREIQKQASLVKDSIINNYIDSLGSRLVSHSYSPATNFHFFVVQDSDINAFAGPGGYVGVYAGLILITRTESELAAAMAHEITHVEQHHIARAIAREKQLALPSVAAMLAAILIGTQTNTNVATGAITAASGGEAQDMLKHIRGFEQEADRIGLETLHRAGFDPAALPNFLLHMQAINIDYDEGPNYLQTHPITEKRVADAKERAEQYPLHTVNSSLEYYLIRARLRVLITDDANNVVEYFAQHLQSHNQELKAAAQYGYAYALFKNKKITQARKIMEHLIKENPSQIYYYMTLSNVYSAAHQKQQAEQLLIDALKIYPDFYPLIIQYADLLLHTKKNHQLLHFLHAQIENYPNSIALLAMLAKAQARTNNLVAAYQTRAKIFTLLGNHRMALLQLQQALKQQNISSYDRVIIKAKIGELTKP